MVRQISIEDGKAAEFLRAESGADVGAIDFQERGLFGDFDLCGFSFDAKCGIDAGGSVNLNFGSGFEGAESRRGYSNACSVPRAGVSVRSFRSRWWLFDRPYRDRDLSL